MSAEKKRIGLVLASIHTGAAQGVWPSFVKTALIEDKSLFIFPGGRLNARQDSENLRNSVYSLVNRDNLDGFISWCSTIRYTEPKEEFELFHSGFDPLPCVTLAYKIPGHPCVEFDAYTGIKMLITHSIRVHGAKRIAFLRGPDFHPSALARFKGYQDALKEAGLPVSSGNPLVTDPFNWDNGDAAAAQLFESRDLKPGKDFDTLIGSSDLMTLGAVSYLAKQGYHLPRDYHALSFNNSVESRLTESPLSTVHIPYSTLSSESFRILLNILGKKNGSVKADRIEDLNLPTEVIIRESCGCGGSHFFPAKPEGNRQKKKQPMSGQSGEEALTAMIAGYLKLSGPDLSALVTPVIRALFNSSTEHFFNLFEKALLRFFDSNRDTELLFGLLEEISRSGLVSPPLVRRLEPALYRTIFKVREQLAVHSQYEKENWNTALNSLKCELLGTRDRKSLVQNLARHLPKIGINTAGIALYGDDKTSLWVGSFSQDGISPVREQPFPARLLVPESLRRQFSRGIFMVQPLFIENQSLGYFVHTVPVQDGLIFEELRSAVSYALKGIFQLEEVVRARRIAEQAERAKTEFLQTLENELHDPFAGITEKIEALEKQPKKSAAFGDELELLKSFVTSREERVESLIDLAHSRIGELALTKTLLNPEELLPGIGSVKSFGAFPLIPGDSSKLSQCFSFIREEYPGDFSAAVAYGGLKLSFRAGTAAVKERKKRREQRLLLSERIILMHGGEIKRNNSACTIILPWPTLTGQNETLHSPGRQEHILTLSGETLPAELSDLPLVQDPEKAAKLPGRTAFIVWNTADAGPEALLKAASLRYRSEFLNTAFLCYGKEFIGKDSIIGGVEALIRSPKKGTILFVGRREDGEPFKGLPADEIYIPSMTAFNETVAEISPALIVFNSINTEGAATVRRHPITVTVPVIMVSRKISSAADVMALSQYSRLIICHRSVAASAEFNSRLRALLAGDEILPPHTGALVKKTILYFDVHTESNITRWKLADAVNVNED